LQEVAFEIRHNIKVNKLQELEQNKNEQKVTVDSEINYLAINLKIISNLKRNNS